MIEDIRKPSKRVTGAELGEEGSVQCPDGVRSGVGLFRKEPESQCCELGDREVPLTLAAICRSRKLPQTVCNEWAWPSFSKTKTRSGQWAVVGPF